MSGRRAAALFGVAAAFVAAVDLARWIRPLLLADPDPGWAAPRLLLGLFVIAAAASAGGAAAGLFCLLARRLDRPAVPLPFSGGALLAVALLAFAAGTAARFVSLSRLPPSLWIDDVSMISPALALDGSPRDFADAIRPAPYGVPRPYGSVGVLYLELFRLVLFALGANIFGLRFLSAAAGAASIATAMLVARELLPRGGAALAGSAAAGLRWSLILSRWGWNAMVMLPLVDGAAWLMLKARRRGSLTLAALAGIAAGLAAHVYLAAWIAAAALAALALWPRGDEPSARVGWRPALAFAGAFLLAAAPIFLFREGRRGGYFARAADHSLAKEFRYTHSAMPALAAAADSVVAPWAKPDPYAHHDLPGRVRLDWILGLPVAVALCRSLARPREEFSAYLLCQGGAALAGSIAGGHAGVPNGYRFLYMATPACVAAAGGALCLLSFAGPARRRAAALGVIGLFAVSGALSIRDALGDWPRRRETFDGFHGQDTLIARTAIRWERYGPVEVAPGLGHSEITIGGIRRYRLDPDAASGERPPTLSPGRSFRVAAAGAAAGPGERIVERVRDAWGREWGVVLGRSARAS